MDKGITLMKKGVRYSGSVNDVRSGDTARFVTGASEAAHRVLSPRTTSEKAAALLVRSSKKKKKEETPGPHVNTMS